MQIEFITVPVHFTARARLQSMAVYSTAEISRVFLDYFTYRYYCACITLFSIIQLYLYYYEFLFAKCSLFTSLPAAIIVGIVG